MDDFTSKISVYYQYTHHMCVGNNTAERRNTFFPYPFVGRDESTVNSNMLVVAKVWVCDLMRNCFGESQLTTLLPFLITSTEISLTKLSQLIHMAWSPVPPLLSGLTRVVRVFFGRHGGYRWGQPDIHGCIFSAVTLVGIQYRLFLELPPATSSTASVGPIESPNRC